MSCLAEKHRIADTNGAFARIVVWSGLGVCAIAATVYDIGHWMAAW